LFSDDDKPEKKEKEKERNDQKKYLRGEDRFVYEPHPKLCKYNFRF
jgi:hypothetical protein